MPAASALTDQLEGWGTAGAAVVAMAALLAGVAAYRTQSAQLRLQQEQIDAQAEVLALQVAELRAAIQDRKRQEWERQRAQAVQVYIVEELREEVAERGRPSRRLVATVRNASPLPIHDPTMIWHEGAAEVTGILPPYLAPGAAASHEYIGVDGESADPPSGVSATARFRDAAGSWWEISPHGSPQPLPAPPESA
ncbi:hypothetical protein [Plantactinospora sp. CA-290183]|uniref:hypothetical protein n=1 Tax=Plantactinospora sp. CA-290183 TaxID=3240006 RepID=UPI003D8D3952